MHNLLFMVFRIFQPNFDRKWASEAFNSPDPMRARVLLDAKSETHTVNFTDYNTANLILPPMFSLKSVTLQ